jgi:hypothetical protein
VLAHKNSQRLFNFFKRFATHLTFRLLDESAKCKNDQNAENFNLQILLAYTKYYTADGHIRKNCISLKSNILKTQDLDPLTKQLETIG